MNTYRSSEAQEVRLSVRDLLSIGGVALTLITAMWAFSSDIKTTLAMYGLRLGILEKRLEGLEAKTVRESSPDYREQMRRWMGQQPTPPAQLPPPGDDGE
jgi:hypothetical protein